MFPALETAQRPRDIGQSQNRIAQRAHLAWRRAAECGPAGQTFEIAHAVERFTQALTAPAVVDQDLHGVEPAVDRGGIDERSEQPAAQQPTSHGRQCTIEHFEQCGAFDTRSQRLDELEVAARHLIEWQDVASMHDCRMRKVRQPARL